jgi:UPF0755 protein
MSRPNALAGLRIPAALVAVFLVFSLLLLFLPGINSAPSDRRRSPITVHRGDGFSEIVGRLLDAGVIRSRWPVLLTGAVFPDLHKIKPGRYLLPHGLSNYQLLHYLHTHPQDEVRIMIPNGIEQRKIAEIIAENLDIDSAAFMKASGSRELLASLQIGAASTEGYLFPGTYNFAWSSRPEEVIRFLVGQFRKFYSDSLRDKTIAKGFSEHQLLTLASIVEAETPEDHEKPIIASVYLNRMRKNMKLQADPTVQYALEGDARRLFFKDLAVDSPYNTYRQPGLPPGPICNPGPSSILAVLHPAETGYLYFVATGKGGHFFASTLAEHDRNIRKYRSVIQETGR